MFFFAFNENQIEMIADLPVGRNLENHLLLQLQFSVEQKHDFVTMYYNLREENFAKYLKGEPDGVLDDEGEGPQTFFVSTLGKQAGEKDWPDLRNFESTPLLNSDNVVTGIMYSGVQRARSIGSILLNVTAYLAGERRKSHLALIDYKLLQNKVDRQLLVGGNARQCIDSQSSKHIFWLITQVF